MPMLAALFRNPGPHGSGLDSAMAEVLARIDRNAAVAQPARTTGPGRFADPRIAGAGQFADPNLLPPPRAVPSPGAGREGDMMAGQLPDTAAEEPPAGMDKLPPELDALIGKIAKERDFGLEEAEQLRASLSTDAGVEILADLEGNRDGLANGLRAAEEYLNNYGEFMRGKAR
mgnify:CR=1 FL=1